MTTITQLESRVNLLEEQLTKLSPTKESGGVYKMTKSEQAGVNRGLRDIAAGRVYTQDEFDKKIQESKLASIWK